MNANEVFVFLKQKGFNVFLPAQHIGECDSKYVVVKQGSASPFNVYSSAAVFVDVLAYVPISSGSILPAYVESIKTALTELAPSLKFTYNETAPFVDDSIGAIMHSMSYSYYRLMH